MGYGGYAGDPRGRERAIESRQQERDDVQSQVDSFSAFKTPTTPEQKTYSPIKTKTPTTYKSFTRIPKSVPAKRSTYDGPPVKSTWDGPQKSTSEKIYESVVGSPAKPANLYGSTGHFANQQIIENQAKLGNISHKYADQLKGKDIAQQGINPMLGMLMGGPYQMITNAIDQGDIWGGITSGANQAISNIQGILSAYGMWDIGNAPPQSDSNSAWINLLQRITQGGSN